MPTVLLVGEWDGETATALSERGYAMRRGDAEPDVARHAATTDCALVWVGDGADAAVEALVDADPDLPVLAVGEDVDEIRIRTLEERGATDAVDVAGGDGVGRLLASLERYAGTPLLADGDTSERRATEETASVPVGDGDRIPELLESARNLTAADTVEAVADIVVETATEVLEFEAASVHLLDGGGRGGPARGEAGDGGATSRAVTADAAAREAGVPADVSIEAVVEEGRPVAVEDGAASGAAGPVLAVPIGSHGVVVLETGDADALDGPDRQAAELLVANATAALDRVERTHELGIYESVFEAVADMVFVLDDEGRVVDCTPLLAERLGYEQEFLVGRDVGEFFEEHAAGEGSTAVRELIDEPEGTTRTLRVDVTTADGDDLPLEVDLSLLPGEEFRGIVGSVHDITDLLAVRERLDSQQDRFEYLFENIPDPVLEADLSDGTSTAVTVNPAFEEVFGFDEEELVGRPLNDVIVPPDGKERARHLDEEAREGKISTAQIERDTQYGVRQFLFRGIPYTTADGRIHGFAIYTDITEQRERERHLDVLQRVFRHNVRNDVNVLLGEVDRLEASGADEEVREALEATARNLLEMSRKAKRISRVLDADRKYTELVDVGDVVTTVVEDYRDASTEATITASVSSPGEVLGSQAIARAVEELVGNAVEHAGEAPTVEVSAEAVDDRVEITVADDGPGIPQAEREVLQDAEITPLQHGSGLGLWLVNHATTSCGGTVSFDDYAAGASVTLSFRRPKGEP